MSLINVSNLTFAYDGSYENVFENISFQIDTDWKLGFTGRNGRGKTTFLNLLLGKYKFEGTISYSVDFDYFPFEVKNPSADTLDVAEEVCPDFVYWQLVKELSLLEVREDILYRPFNTLSEGEKTKVMLALLFLKENSFLLIDEPTNHLDMHGREVLGEYLNRKSGFILVSHDRSFLDSCTDHTLAINKMNIEVVKGSFSSWYYNKSLQDSFEFEENRKLKKEAVRLEKAAREKAVWSDRTEKTKYATKNSGLRPDRGYIGRKSAKMMKRAKTIESRRQNAADEKTKLLKNIESSEKLKIHQPEYHTNRFVSFDRAAISYGERNVFSDVSFCIEKGDRIALCGSNGSGKSSIIKLICGENISYRGNVKIGNNLKISYVPQNTSFLSGSLSEIAEKYSLDESLFKAILRKLDFSREQFDKKTENFSAGQKKKVLIAKSLCEKAHLHIWDEPLNFIDVNSRIQIENLISEYEPTLLFVEHDKAFCDKTANKTIRL